MLYRNFVPQADGKFDVLRNVVGGGVEDKAVSFMLTPGKGARGASTSSFTPSRVLLAQAGHRGQGRAQGAGHEGQGRAQGAGQGTRGRAGHKGQGTRGASTSSLTPSRVLLAQAGVQQWFRQGTRLYDCNKDSRYYAYKQGLI
jgi:hypothetical protein